MPWMGEETKKAGRGRSWRCIRNKIGYPEKWRDYSQFTVERDDLLGNVNRGGEFEQQRNLNKLGKPVDETEWDMTPPTVNAYYKPQHERHQLSSGHSAAAVLSMQRRTTAVNFGGIGVVIGHEMTHGFDDQGTQVRRQGQPARVADAGGPQGLQRAHRLRGARSTAASRRNRRANVNGKLTLGENTADNGGIRIAYLALMNTLAAEGKDAGRPEDRRLHSGRSVSLSASDRSGARTGAGVLAR